MRDGGTFIPPKSPFYQGDYFLLDSGSDEPSRGASPNNEEVLRALNSVFGQEGKTPGPANKSIRANLACHEVQTIQGFEVCQQYLEIAPGREEEVSAEHKC